MSRPRAARADRWKSVAHAAHHERPASRLTVATDARVLAGNHPLRTARGVSRVRRHPAVETTGGERRHERRGRDRGDHGERVDRPQHATRSALLESFRAPDRPEVVRQIAVADVVVGDSEISLHPPVGTPRVTYQEAFVGVVVSDPQHRVAAEELLLRFRHGHDAGLGDLLRLEAFVHRESEDERIAIGEAGAHA